MSDQTPKPLTSDQAADLRFLKDPYKWPHMVAPLKKRDHKVGIRTAVYIPGQFSEQNMISLSRMTQEEADKVVWTPMTPEEVIAAGWEVD